MHSTRLIGSGVIAALLALFALPATAQSFRVQCPTHTALHPLVNASGAVGTPTSTLPNPHIKCQQLSGGDGFATMGDGTQTYLFAFGPLSGLADIEKGLPATETAVEFNKANTGAVLNDVRNGAPWPGYTFNGAIGLTPEQNSKGVASVSFGNNNSARRGSGYKVGDLIVFSGGGAVQAATGVVTTVSTNGTLGRITGWTITSPGTGYQSEPTVTVSSVAGINAAPTAALTNADTLTGNVDPRLVMDVGVLNGNIPAPLIAIDEGDELFLTLTNVGQVMRPDLFEQHTVHFHGYPNASAFYDGVPDASVAINIGGSFTYYYLAPEAGTYIWHCHISPPEHLQMGMVGQIYVRPRQDTVTGSTSLYSSLKGLNTGTDPATRCATTDILCSNQTPATDNGALRDPAKNTTPLATQALTYKVNYAYDDGDGTTAYNVEYPIQMHGFDPNFHFVGMTFNPESFADNKDKYFLLNGRSYPDTVGGYVCGTSDPVAACKGKSSGTVVPGPMSTQSSDTVVRNSQPLPAVVNIPVGGRALLRFSDLNVTEFHTLASLGIQMHVVGFNARLLRDQDGTNTDYYTNSITLGGGESVDVILDASDTATYQVGRKYYLYTPQLDHLSNDAENFGGMMTEVNICASVDPTTKACGT